MFFSIKLIHKLSGHWVKY